MNLLFKVFKKILIYKEIPKERKDIIEIPKTIDDKEIKDPTKEIIKQQPSQEDKELKELNVEQKVEKELTQSSFIPNEVKVLYTHIITSYIFYNEIPEHISSSGYIFKYFLDLL